MHRPNRSVVRHFLLALLATGLFSLASLGAGQTTGQDKDTTDAKVAELVKGLQDKKPQKRVQAAQGLQAMGKDAKEASSAIVKVMFDPVPDVRFAAAFALQAVNPPLHQPVVKLLEPIVPQDLLNDRETAIEKLIKLGKEAKAAVPVLLYYQRLVVNRGIPGKDQVAIYQTCLIAEALATVAPDDPQVTKLLVAWLTKVGEPDIREAAALSLPGMDDAKTVVNTLAQALTKDPVGKVRVAAAKALGAIGADAKDAVPALNMAANDQDPAVRLAAKKALKLVDKK
jgi:HEAT repeat protein